MTKTDIICKGLRYSGMLAGKAAVLRLGLSSKLRILAYHRVLDDVADDFPFDRDVISCSSDEFRCEMEFVARNFDVVTFKDIAENGAESYRCPLIITFDDGYKDNYDIAFSILKEVGIPAVFYVTTDYIDGNSIPWWDEVTYLCGRGGGKVLSVCRGERLFARTMGEDMLPELLDHCKSVSDEERIELLEKIRNVGAEDIPAVQRGLMMNWDNVRELAGAGMEIGSHTVSHPMLRNIDNKEKLRNEIVDSKEKIEKEIKSGVYSFSYPVGRKSSADADIVDMVIDAGYNFAVMYEHGVNRKDDLDIYRLLRIKTEVGSDFDRFRAKVLFPRLVRY
jgi:peptidoglycan/xylan/chitin deacetylase (PgdA/CDA1 family)